MKVEAKAEAEAGGEPQKVEDGRVVEGELQIYQASYFEPLGCNVDGVTT